MPLQKDASLYAPYTFSFNNGYTYQYVPSIDQGINPIDFHSHNNLYETSISGALVEGQDFFVGMGFNTSAKSSFSFLYFSLEYRIALLNQLVGDPFSLQIAPVITFVPRYKIRDPNTPFQNILCPSLLLSIGAEMDRDEQWIARFFFASQIGISNNGGPFLDLDLRLFRKFDDRYILSLGVQELIGFGKYNVVNIDAFEGWSKIDHRSTALTASFGYIIDVYGTLEFSCAYRPFSRSYLQNDSSLGVAFNYPFSP